MINEHDAPDGFRAKNRGEKFCYECAFHPGAGADFAKCIKQTGNRCSPSCRDDKLFVVFVATHNAESSGGEAVPLD